MSGERQGAGAPPHRAGRGEDASPRGRSRTGPGLIILGWTIAHALALGALAPSGYEEAAPALGVPVGALTPAMAWGSRHQRPRAAGQVGGKLPFLRGTRGIDGHCGARRGAAARGTCGALAGDVWVRAGYRVRVLRQAEVPPQRSVQGTSHNHDLLRDRDQGAGYSRCLRHGPGFLCCGPNGPDNIQSVS